MTLKSCDVFRPLEPVESDAWLRGCWSGGRYRERHSSEGSGGGDTPHLTPPGDLMRDY